MRGYAGRDFRYTITGNVVFDNGGHGIDVAGACLEAHDNVAQRNGDTGIRLFADSLYHPGQCVSEISGNNASSNGEEGISVENNGSRVRVTGNVAHNNGGDGIRVGQAHGTEESPTWSPDGKRVAFISDRDGQKDIYVANADGSGVRRLTSTAVVEQALEWSPDGKYIGFLPGSHPAAQPRGCRDRPDAASRSTSSPRVRLVAGRQEARDPKPGSVHRKR